MDKDNTMRAARALGPQSLGVEDVPMPIPAPDEIRIRVEACGICGSDLHFFSHNLMPVGLTPGHEIAGVVDAVGDRVAGVRVGTRAVVEPIEGCGSCVYCRSGRHNICREFRLYGLHVPGGLAEYITVPGHRVFPIADDLEPEIAALAEPVAVAVHGLASGGFEAGQRVLVMGAGVVGLATLLAARSLGAGEVWISARHPQQADLARRLGASRVLSESEASPKALSALGRTADLDLAVETVGGSANTLLAASAALRPGGTLSVVGVFLQSPALDPYTLLLKELNLCWSNCYQRRPDGEGDFAVATRLIQDEREQLAGFVTHQFPLEEIDAAFATATNKKAGAVKVTVRP
jgi:L-iditol 2-dehydrogenase